MTFGLRFRDHRNFQRSVLWAIAAAAVTGVTYWLTAETGIGKWLTAIVAGFSLSGVLGIERPTAIGRHWAFAVRSLLAFVGFATLISTNGYVALVGFGAALGAAFALDRRGVAGITAAIVGGFGSVIALEVAVRFAGSDLLSGMPGAGIAAASGATFALALAAPLAIRHLSVVRDVVVARYREVWSSTSGEVQDLVGRGYGVWTESSALPEGDENRELLREAALRLFDTAAEWGQSQAGEKTSESTLLDRMASLSERIEATEDGQTRAEYQQAHDALAEQLKYLGGIKTNRERVIARLHNYLAAMERLRLAVVTAKSSNAASVIPVASDLRELGEDISTL